MTALVSCASSKPTLQNSAAGADAESGSSADSVSCRDLKYDADDPGTADAPTLCSRYRDEMLPAVATAAVHCMQAADWSVCDVSRCATQALASVPTEEDARCARVEEKCPEMGEHCGTYIAGMKPAGRDRFATCLIDHCGNGLRFCLWDAMVTPCETSSAPAGSARGEQFAVEDYLPRIE